MTGLLSMLQERKNSIIRLPDVECKLCVHKEPNCGWLTFHINADGKVEIKTKTGETVVFRVICFCGYGD
jgi:hypothetical protein